MDMVEFIQGFNTQFSEEDKDSCLPVVEKMVELANLARMNGLLAFDEAAKSIDNDFLKTAVTMVADSMEFEETRNMLQILILSEKYSNAELLSRLVMTVGILDILNGDNPRLIKEKLLGMLGEKHTSYLWAEERERAERETRIKTFMEEMETQMQSTEVSDFDELVTNMNRESLRRVLRDIPDDILAKALKGVENFRVLRRLFKYAESMSDGRKIRLIDMYESYEQISPAAISKAQEEIIGIINKLDEEGEIILSLQRDE